MHKQRNSTFPFAAAAATCVAASGPALVLFLLPRPFSSAHLRRCVTSHCCCLRCSDSVPHRHRSAPPLLLPLRAPAIAAPPPLLSPSTASAVLPHPLRCASVAAVACSHCGAAAVATPRSYSAVSCLLHTHYHDARCLPDAALRPSRCRFASAQPTLRAQPPPLQPRICVAVSQQHLLRLCRHRRNDCSGRRNDYSGRHHDLDS